VTFRQQQVVNLLMEFPSGGRNTNATIGRKLGISERTVKKHIVDIAKALEIDGSRFILRSRIVYLEAIRRGMIKEDL
jgi:DNA-binding NarL/FixJ family response regulator